jgi:hypothetical protein
MINLMKRKNEYSVREYSNKLNYVREHVDSKEIMSKIENFIERSGSSFDKNDVKKQIMNNDMFAAWFIKDSSKQNFFEKEQLAILKENNKNIKKLSASGKNSIKLVDGELIYGYKGKTGTKSLDFIENLTSHTVLYYTKHTDITGGAQDNQYADAITFLKEAIKYVNNHNDNFRFVALLDGGLYQKESFKKEFDKLTNERVKVHNINSILEENWK